ncbi:MAG: hypothetical protein DRI37_01220 [Chloroflexi bacterium]|nr:MAG: hypothetical protein DRI37_01220 [Chloroflexota bacterium]
MDTEIPLLQERWLWLAGSLGIALSVSWAGWFVRRSRVSQWPWLERWQQWRGRFWLVQSARLLYAIGIPVVALFWRGAFTERGLGLQPWPWSAAVSPGAAQANWENWVRDLGWAMAIMAGTGVLLALGRRITRHTIGKTLPLRRDLGVALRETVYHQVHWAFYREPFVLIGGISNGAWLGLLPVVLEAVLNPARWADLRSPQRGHDLLVRAALAVASILVYIQTQNLWLALFVDAVLGWAAGSAVEGEYER